MNAAPPVSQAPPGSDAVQANAPAPAAAAPARAAGQDFAAALSAAGKPARKGGANKDQDLGASGNPLPASGNQTPLGPTAPLAPTPPPPAKTDALAAEGPAALDSAPLADAASAMSPSRTNASAVAPGLTSELLDAAAPPATAPGADTTTPANDPTGSGSGSGSGLAIPQTGGIRTTPAPATSSAPANPAAPSANVRTARLSDAAGWQLTDASAHSAPFFSDANRQNDPTLSNGPAAGGTDAITQAAMAAVAARSTNSPAPDSSSSEDGAIAETGVAQGVAVLTGAAAGAPADVAPAAALAQATAVISAAMTAATAASVAQAASAAATISAADKRTHGTGPDSTLLGASNDGAAGAAQLLTSNSSNDGAPSPAFKVTAGVDTAQFGQGVADRISLMLDGNLTNAKLQVNPPALGPIEVRIALQGGHAQVSFSSHSAVTRDALESSSAKLREMLGSQGFSSVSVDISRRSFQERSPQPQAYESAPRLGAEAPALAEVSMSISRGASGLLDAYA